MSYLKTKDLSATVAMAMQGGAGGLVDIGSAEKKEKGRVKKCMEFAAKIDVDGSLTAAVNEELYDGIREQRVRRLDRFTQNLDQRRYAEFSKARQISFMAHGQKFKASQQKFYDWLTKDDITNIKIDKSAVEVFAFMANETVGHLVETSLISKRETSVAEHDATTGAGGHTGELEFQGIERSLPAQSYNPQFPMIQVGEDMSPLRKRLRSGLNSASSSSSNGIVNPIKPDDIRETYRRLTTRAPNKYANSFRRTDARHQRSEVEIPILAL